LPKRSSATPLPAATPERPQNQWGVRNEVQRHVQNQWTPQIAASASCPGMAVARRPPHDDSGGVGSVVRATKAPDDAK
jgi:hypothetical protein